MAEPAMVTIWPLRSPASELHALPAAWGHPDQLDPDQCARCRKAPSMVPRSHAGMISEGRLPQPLRDLCKLILCHWDDPDVPADQLDHWDALAEAATPPRD